MNTTQLLSNECVRLRAVEPTDIDIILSWENDTSIWYVGNTVAPYSRKALWDYVENYNPDIYSERQLRLMVVDNQTDETVGMVDLFDFDAHNRRCGVGIIIGQEYRNKGYGSEALRLLHGYARKFLGLHQLWTHIPTDNDYSVALFSTCGYKISGRLRSWLRRNDRYTDVFVLQSLADEL